MSLLNVAVLRGGPSSEYDVSLRTGANIISKMPTNMTSLDLLVSRSGDWHVSGIKKEPIRALNGMHVVINAMHGQYGEDGTLQKILDHAHIPYTGAGPLGAFLSMHKILAKDKVSTFGVPVANGVRMDKSTYSKDALFEVKRRVGDEIVLKPARNGSSLGIFKANDIDEMSNYIEKAFLYDETVLAEEYIDGIELSCGVLENFDDENIFALFPVEIEHSNTQGIWDSQNKYNKDAHKYHIPARVPNSVRRAVQQLSIIAHQALMLRHYSRSDFIYHPKRGIFFLETNALPGLTETSIYPFELESAGISMPDFIEHIVTLAIKN